MAQLIEARVMVARPRSFASGESGELRRGLPVLVACSVGLMFAVGTIFTYGSGVIAVALSGEFGWTRLQVSLPLSALFYCLMFGSLLAGRFVDRFGPRMVILISGALLGGGLVALSMLPPSLPLFVALHGAIALGASGTLPISYSRVIVAWFERRRGIALGVSMTGVGIGAILLPPFAQALIDWQGWRAAYLGYAALILGISLPLSWWLLHMPRQDHLNAGQPVWHEPANRGAMIGLGAISLFGGVAMTGMVVHLAPLLIDRGIAPATAVRYASALGLSVIAGRLFMGALMDRFFAPRILAAFLIGPMLACLIIATSDSSWAYLLAAILIGLSQGAEIDALAYLVSKYAPAQRFGAFYGGMFALFTLGAANGPLLLGWAHGWSGDYGPGLVVVAALSLATAIVAMALPSYSSDLA